MSGTLDTAALADLLASSGSSYGALAPGSNPDTSGFNRYTPGGGSWWDRNFGDNAGAGSSANLTKALQGWGKQAGEAGASGGDGGGQGGAPMSNSPTGNPRRAVDLNALVQKLLQQQQAYQGNIPVAPPRVLGLLGF